MTPRLDFQSGMPAGVSVWVPDEELVGRWVRAALGDDSAELTVRVVAHEEMAALNETYRGKPGPTNVLSFPFDAPEAVETTLLGDVVVCAPVVAQEAVEQDKLPEAHWAHMVVHGCLHLLGYDHLDEVGAARMEALESAILRELGYADPWEV